MRIALNKNNKNLKRIRNFFKTDKNLEIIRKNCSLSIYYDIKNHIKLLDEK